MGAALLIIIITVPRRIANLAELWWRLGIMMDVTM